MAPAMRLPRRFDDALMTPPDAHAPVDASLLALVRTWCEAGELLQVAGIASHPGLDGAACTLDGSHELTRLGRWRGLVWRLQILWRERVGGAPVPWDCGWWREGTLQAAETFRPRRPTLLMVREPAAAQAAALLSALRANSPHYRHPVRLLVVSAATVAGIPRLNQAVMRGS